MQGRREPESIPIGAALDLLCLAKAREELMLDGLPFQLLQLQLNENCIYISAERQISNSHQPLVP